MLGYFGRSDWQDMSEYVVHFTADTDDGSATWHRVAYSIAATQDSMRRAELPFRLIERLSYGV